MREGGILRLKGPANKSGKSLGLILQSAKALQGIDAVGQGFNVAKHHGARRSAAEFMPGAVNREPLLGKTLVDGDGSPHAIYQDFAPSSRKAAHARIFQSYRG